MRIRILPLTPETVGDVTTTPFVLVLDRESDLDSAPWKHEMAMRFKESIGARCLIISDEPVWLDASALDFPNDIIARIESLVQR